MKTEIFGATKAERGLIGAVADAASSRLSQTDEKVFCCVYFCGRRKIRRLNCVYRSVDAVTDVLSFPALEISAGQIVRAEEFKTDVDFSTGTLCLGDIFICRARACAQARRYGHSLRREKAFLALHGILHLLGYDHMNEAAAAQMERQAEEILSALKITRDN